MEWYAKFKWFVAGVEIGIWRKDFRSNVARTLKSVLG